MALTRMRAVHVRGPPWSVLRGYSAWVAASEPHDAPSRRVDVPSMCTVLYCTLSMISASTATRPGGHPRVNVSGSSLKERGQGCGDRPESCVELIVTPQSPQGIPPKPKPLWAGPLHGGDTLSTSSWRHGAHMACRDTGPNPGSWHMGARDRTVRNKRKGSTALRINKMTV